MLFSEIYCVYFNTVAVILCEVMNGPITEKRILQIVNEKAFSESMLTILPAIKNEEWLVMNRQLQTPVKHKPQMPLTILQKRWMKSLLTDPRVSLFNVDITGLENIDPLFVYDDFVFFDRYTDGDPYEDEGYIATFKMILRALKEKRRIHIKYRNRRNFQMQAQYIPYKLEYSSKDDKFRLETAGGRYSAYVNVARIDECELLEPYSESEQLPPRRKDCRLTFVLKDERSALDRVMLHFSDCRKETRRLDNGRYQVHLWYEAQDETEILIRILSFGPLLCVTAPDGFIRLIRNRLEMQTSLKK